MSEGKGEIPGSVHRIPVQYVAGLMGTKKHSVSLSICTTCSLNSAFSVCLLLSLCIVSGHLIAIYTPHHLSRKEGFSIWMQEYSMELRVRKCSQLLQETGAKDYKSHPELKRSFYFLHVRMSLVSVTVLLPFSCLPPSLSILLPWHLPRWALFQHSCSQTSVLPLYHFLIQVPNGDLWVIEWQFHISREVSDWPRLGQLTTWWLSLGGFLE